jgi:hypothetical protein
MPYDYGLQQNAPTSEPPCQRRIITNEQHLALHLRIRFNRQLLESAILLGHMGGRPNQSTHLACRWANTSRRNMRHHVTCWPVDDDPGRRATVLMELVSQSGLAVRRSASPRTDLHATWRTTVATISRWAPNTTRERGGHARNDPAGASPCNDVK